jgi:hypothetical protein
MDLKVRGSCDDLHADRTRGSARLTAHSPTAIITLPNWQVLTISRAGNQLPSLFLFLLVGKRLKPDFGMGEKARLLFGYVDHFSFKIEPHGIDPVS